MAETITVTTQLMPNGVRFTFEPAWDESDYREGLEHRLKKIKTLSVMGRVAEVIRKPGFMEFVDENPPANTWIARGLPIKVNAKLLASVEESNAAAKAEHRFEDHIDVVENEGAQWILSPFAGCRRIAVNVRSRLAVARQLHCEYQVTKGVASWVGQMPLRVEG